MSSPAVPYTVASATEYNLLRAEVGAVAVRGWRRRTTSSGSTTSTDPATALKVMEVSAPIIAGHFYWVELVSGWVYSPAVGGMHVQLTYTTNGSTPTVTSTRFRQSPWQTPGANQGAPARATAFYPATTSGTLRVLASIYGYIAGTYTMYATSDTPIDQVIFDMGVAPAQTGADF